MKRLHSTEHLSICQYGKMWRERGSQDDNEGWQRPFVHFLLLPQSYFPLLHLLFYILSPLQPKFSKTLSHTNTQRSLAHWYNSVSSETLLAYAPPWLVRCEMQWVNWPFNLPWHSFLALNTRGMVSSRSMADWGGQPQKSKVTTGGVPRRQGRLSGVSREVCPNPVLPPLLPADSGLPAFITQL